MTPTCPECDRGNPAYRPTRTWGPDASGYWHDMGWTPDGLHRFMSCPARNAAIRYTNPNGYWARTGGVAQCLT